MGKSKKASSTYAVKMTVTPPASSEQHTALTVTGPCRSPEMGRTLWLLCAYMGGLIPPCDANKEIDALRLALERGVPADHKAIDGRLPEDAARMKDTVESLTE